MSGITTAPLSLCEPLSERWTVLRAGIQNVWEYDDRRFVFDHGRLLLRGQNEVGKTKAMELLFPFLLDADLAPQRIDPFGTTARPMHWNLINDADPDVQLRIGYLWLEFGRLDGGGKVFCTIGAGIKARRGSPDVDWFFVTTQRPDADIRFVVDGRPLVKSELTQTIGTKGQVFDRHGDYRRAVNARFFAMSDEQYGALVETLLHLRRPQLSKTLDVDQLSRFLSASLPPLDSSVVGPIAEGFERLDRHRADLEAVEETLGKLRSFEQLYGDYARTIAKGRAQDLARAESAYQRARSDARECSAKRDALLEQREAVEKNLLELHRRERALAEKIRVLEDSEAYRSAKDLDQAETAARTAASVAGDAANRAREDEDLLTKADARALDSAREARERTSDVEHERGAAIELAKRAALAGAHGAVDALVAKGNPESATGAIEAIRTAREALIGQLRHLAHELAQATEAHRHAEDRARERSEDLEAAREALRSAECQAGEAEEAWGAAAEAWLGALRVLPPAELPQLQREPVNPAGFRASVELASEPLRRSISDERAEAGARIAQLRAEQESLRAQRDALASSPHPTPPAPAWRPLRIAARPGAPLYLLCDFGPAAAGAEATIEAALESSGLLDAWIEPDGTLLHPTTEDVILRDDPLGGRTLADVLLPVAGSGIGEDRIRLALASVGFGDAGQTPDGTAWISADGCWRLGPLHGAWKKDVPAYVGAAARERESARRIAELETAMGVLDDTARQIETVLHEAEERLQILAQEMASCPRGVEVEAARTSVTFRAQAHAEARRKQVDAERAASAAEAKRVLATSALDRAAADGGAPSFARDSDVLAELSRSYFEAAVRLIAALRGRERARVIEEREGRAQSEASERAARSRQASQRAAEEASAAASRAGALAEASGKQRDEVLAALDAARGDERSTRKNREAADEQLGLLAEQVGAARSGAEQAEETVLHRDGERRASADELRALGDIGLLAAAGFSMAEAPSTWSFTTVLELARKVDALVHVEVSSEERDKAENRLMTRQTDLAFQLPPEVRVLPSRAGEVLSYQLTWNGRTRTIADVIADMGADASARTKLLGDEEARLLEGFLSGEAHDHLASRLREARALVDRMNTAIEGRTTAAGTQVRLDWALDDAAQADAKNAVPLFLRAGRLLSEANRRTLRAFLQRRLVQARDALGDRSLQDRLLDILDYRTWHRFQVEHRTPGLPWSKLTRKAHAAGSGGKKAVMLHLPLFAAAAAFYDSAGPTAPRIIALDEAFAGIDRPTRGKLMGLLADFDLDFIMTSFEEWGCYEELNGLSTYHLSREPGQRGVFAEWFVWNGRERVLMEAS